MFRGKVKDMLMGRITQECAPLHASASRLGNRGQITPCGDQATDVQAPMRIEIIDHPIIALHVRQLLDHVRQMCSEIRTGPRGAEIPHDLPRWDDKGGQQHARAMPNVFLLAFFGLAGLHQLGGIFALQNLHTGLFVRANHEATVLKKRQGVDIEVTDILCLGLERVVMTLKPVHAPMGFEVCVVEHPPNGRAAHGVRRSLMEERGRDSVEAPPRGSAVVIDRFTGRDGHDVHLG
jgi:hypothetical protein